MVDGKKEYTFLWFIENYNCCWHDNGEKLISPECSPDGLASTSWNLRLYPRGNLEEEAKSKISLFLVRSENDAGPEKFHLKFELSAMAADGSSLKSRKCERTFEKGNARGINNFLCVDEVLLRKKDQYLPQNVLSLRCKIWYGEGSVHEAGQYSARTRIGIEKISFVQKVENFSRLETHEKKVLQIVSQSRPEYVISSSLYLTDSSCCQGKVIVEIESNKRGYILHKLNISLLNGLGNIIECGEVDNRFEGIRKDVQKLPLSLTRKNILDKSVEYLPNDELSLLCECIFSTGIEFEKVEETQHKLPMTFSKKVCKIVSNKAVYNTEEKLSACTSASEDMKAIYESQFLTDVVLKTKTKTFPANKIVLSARSSVFKAMLNEDVKEKSTDYIQVDDLENETVEQLLLFLYSDNLEILEWESAIKLYCISNEYAIEKLMVLCSSFLVDNLNISNACELLLLTDTYNDSDLKNFAEDFIFKHKEQIIETEEWQNLEKTNPQFVKRTINLMIKGKKGDN